MLCSFGQGVEREDTGKLISKPKFSSHMHHAQGFNPCEPQAAVVKFGRFKDGYSWHSRRADSHSSHSVSRLILFIHGPILGYSAAAHCCSLVVISNVFINPGCLQSNQSLYLPFEVHAAYELYVISIYGPDEDGCTFLLALLSVG